MYQIAVVRTHYCMDRPLYVHQRDRSVLRLIYLQGRPSGRVSSALAANCW